MSEMWLLPQYIVMGIAEALSALGHFDVLFNIVNQTTSRDGKPSWVADNVNEAHFDYYYWLLGGLSLLNVFYYIICYRTQIVGLNCVPVTFLSPLFKTCEDQIDPSMVVPVNKCVYSSLSSATVENVRLH
ncbi:hypothetical protein GQ457_09G006610 [Hibiscus cannabinus]